ncbi:MAG: nucleoside-diphosphate kinase [Candidatus Pacebacteria bacterium]|nr:nucleoside-diphosphate kinase [Candidatus Paceibacterota bacterium]
MEGINLKNYPKKEEELEKLVESSDVAVDAESGLALVVIKPDAFSKRDQIVKRLESSGLYIVRKKMRKLPDDFVIGQMYGADMPKGIREETLKHFNSGPSEVILVNGGPDILNKIVKVTGEHTDPNRCDESSIRYAFGEHFMREANDGSQYSRNAVHRAKNGKERAEDLEKFKPLL